MAKVDLATRRKVVSLHKLGLSQAMISRQTGVSRCAVQALLQKHKDTGSVEDQRRSGRPRKLSRKDERHIQLIRLRNCKMSSTDITSELAVIRGTLVDPSTVRRSLARHGLNGRPTDKKRVPQGEKSPDETLSDAEKPEKETDDTCKQEGRAEEEVKDSNIQTEQSHEDRSPQCEA